MRRQRTSLRLPLALVVAVTVMAAGCSSGTADTTGDEATVPTTAVSTTTTPSATTTQLPTKDIAYTVDNGMQLDVYAPQEPGPWPVVIVAHGCPQSRSPFQRLAEDIATEGAVVFNVDFDCQFPPLTGIEDIACAVRFARSAAADYGGDPTRITLVGNSAGASNGVIVGIDGDDFSGDCVVTEGSALLDGFVGYEGDYDRASATTSPPSEPDLDLVASREEDPDLWEAIDPYSHIGGNPDLVVHLIHGDDTDVAWYEVPRAVSVDFYQALTDAGYDVELTLLDGASHIDLTHYFTEAFDVTVRLVMQVAGG